MLRLAVRSEERSRVFELPAVEATLGASDEADLRAPFRGVSRRHATVRRSGRGVLVIDAGSKNGLVRDGKRYQEILLAPGDSVLLGQATLTLEEISTADAHLTLQLDSHHAGADLNPEETPATASALEVHGAASPNAALAWTRQRSRRPAGEPPSVAEIDGARRALGAEALYAVDLPRDGSTGTVGIRLTSGALPSQYDLGELATRFTGCEGGSGEIPGETAIVPLDDRPTLVRCRAGAAHRRLLVAPLERAQRKPKAWQLDFFEYLADTLLPLEAGDPAPEARAGGDVELAFPEEFVPGRSEAMRKLYAQIRATVRSQLDVLLLGETGTGKELFARMIHASGPTPRGPFLAINCAAIPAELLEAQLFGVEGRIATGVDPRVGLFVKADGGSIFLDEVGELPPALQAKLLRVLQEREVLAIGAHVPRRVKLRVISASNKNLEREVRHERFRADLYYRLRGLQFHLPPLRDRREDIPELVSRFVALAAEEHGKAIAGVSRKALVLLQEYDWPGNVRELRSEIDRAVLLGRPGEPLTSEQFGGVRWHLERRGNESGEVVLPAPAATARNPQPAVQALPANAALDLGAARDELARRLIEEALRKTGGNQSKAAGLLGITRNGLALKLKRLGIDPRGI